MMKYLLIPLIFLVTGCFPHCYRARYLELECTDLCSNVSSAFDSESVCSGDYPGEEWWTFFQDPQLNYLIEMSLASHPDIKIAEARILMAKEMALEARAPLFPHFFLFGDIFREKLSQFASRTQGNAALEYLSEATTYLTSASYELDIWKRNRNAYHAAIDEMVAQVADYEEAKLLLSTSLASVYFDLQFNLELLRIAQERLEARKEIYGLLSQRFETGVIAEFELYETDTEVQMIQDLIYQQKMMIELDKHAIAALVGNTTCGTATLAVEPSALFSTPLPLPSSLPIDLLMRRPDVTAQKYRVEASCLNIQVAKANFFPKIDLLGFIGFGSFKISEMFNSRTLTWQADASSVLPVFTGGELEAKLGIAREAFEIAIETYNQIVLNAVQEVSDALTNLTTADARLGALTRSVADAKSLYDLTNQKFENNIADRIAVLNAVENVLVQEQLEVAVQLDRFQSAVELIKAIGGGYYDCSCN